MPALVPILGHVVRMRLVGVDVVLVLGRQNDLADLAFGLALHDRVLWRNMKPSGNKLKSL